jgi:hypothetical protein
VDTISATHVSKSKYVTVGHAIPNTLPSEDMAKERANQLGKLQHLGAQYVGPNPMKSTNQTVIGLSLIKASLVSQSWTGICFDSVY